MFTKQLASKSIVASLLLALPVFSFAAISAQDQTNFKNRYGNEIKAKTYNNLLSFCDKTDTSIESCLEKLKTQPSQKASIQSQANNYYCCVNVSGGWGEYAYIHGQGYCVPPC